MLSVTAAARSTFAVVAMDLTGLRISKLCILGLYLYVDTRRALDASLVEKRMIHADHEFDFRISDGGVPGVFLPRYTVIQGRLSKGAYERLVGDCQGMGDQDQEDVVRRAVERRYRINGTITRLSNVKPSDITAAVRAERICKRRVG